MNIVLKTPKPQTSAEFEPQSLATGRTTGRGPEQAALPRLCSKQGWGPAGPSEPPPACVTLWIPVIQAAREGTTRRKQTNKLLAQPCHVIPGTCSSVLQNKIRIREGSKNKSVKDSKYVGGGSGSALTTPSPV